MSKHSANEWRAEGESDAYFIKSPNGVLIAIAYNRVDAAHIVRCVNNFDALVEALEAVLKARASVDPEGLFDGLEIIQARAALAAVRSEP